MRQLWAGQRVLVTGATGFLGGHVSRRLVAEGATVVGTSRHARNPAGLGIEWITGTVNDATEASRILGSVEPDVVIHLAADVTARPDMALVQSTLASHLLSTVNLLEWATGKHARVVLPGSLEEPNQSSGNGVPSSPYGAAKLAGRAYAQMFAQLYGSDVVWLRLMMTYGPGQAATKLIPYVATSLMRGESPALSSGARLADWIYVDDVVSAIVTAAHPSRAGLAGKTIDVGSGTMVSTKTLVETLARLVGGDAAVHWGSVADRPAEPSRAADLREAKRLLDWSPATSLEQGLGRTLAWIRDSQRSH